MDNDNEKKWPAGRIFQADSFKEEQFKGNPAGVVFCNGRERKSWMQNMAFEMNLSETAFVTPATGESDFNIRYFTTASEVPLCGHATLASAHVLFEQGLAPREGDLISMNFPSFSISSIDNNTSFAELVGFEPVEMYESESLMNRMPEGGSDSAVST